MNFTLPDLSFDFYLAATPVFVLVIGALVTMLQNVSSRFGGTGAVRFVTYAALLITLAVTLIGFGNNSTEYLQGSYLSEALARFGFVLILTIGLSVALLFDATYLKERFFKGEIASLFLMMILGGLVLVAADEMISLFIGLEIASLATYALVGYIFPTRASLEGAVKYFALGAFATAFLLFGFALLYAGTGSMRIQEIVQVFGQAKDHLWIQIGAVFTLAGLGFKLALAPFHLWGPDAYEGAPTGITAFMATGIKVMVLILMLRFMAIGMQHLSGVWMPGLLILAGLSMIVGNIMALVQTSVKRMLAYSSIAHSGYMAIAICAIGVYSGELPVAAVLFYLVGYTVISIGAFAIVMWLENQTVDNIQVDDFSGLAKRFPLACFALAVFMFSFAGFPPTVGFMSKFFVFNAALKSELYTIVLIGVLGSCISLYYYLRLLVKAYMNKPLAFAAPIQPQKSWAIVSVTGAALILTILLGTVLTDRFLQVAKEASGVIISH